MKMAKDNPKPPLPNIEYHRTAKQFQSEERGWQKVTFYIRSIDRQKNFYDEKIKEKNRLLVLGVWNWEENSTNNPPSEWAFSTNEDQLKMFELVFDNLVKIDERQRFVAKVKKVIEDHGEQIKLKEA